MNTDCQHLMDFMKTQMDVIQKHLEEHQYLRNIYDKNTAVDSFVSDYGWLIREMYCTKICEVRDSCSIALELSISGDLLRNRKK